MGHALGTAFLYYVAFGFPVFIAVAVAVHLGFPRAIERELFCDPHFTSYELATFSSFPMSILRTLAFVHATVAPNTMRRRFGDYDFRARMSRWFVALCFVYVALACLGGVLAVGAALYGVSLSL